MALKSPIIRVQLDGEGRLCLSKLLEDRTGEAVVVIDGSCHSE